MGEKERIFFGSLELAEKERLANTPQRPIVQIAPISPPSPEREMLPFSDKMFETQMKHKRVVDGLEKKKKARTLAIPTNDKLVKARLRELGEPIILFGELPEDRRERLREVMGRLGIEQGMPSSISPATINSKPMMEENELFYTEGTPALKAARQFFLKYSLERARIRLSAAKKKREEEKEPSSDIKDREQIQINNLLDSIKKFTNLSSQVGDERPLTSCAFSPEAKIVMTGGASGVCKLWDPVSCSEIMILKGHSNKVTGVQFHPFSGFSLSPSVVNLATCAADCNIFLWGLDQENPVAKLEGHTERVNRVAFHPSGRFLASTCWDKTWNLWDLETRKAILEQEGHARPVYAVGFQGDGSIIATGGLDALCRIWDLRSGKSILTLRGHVKEILSLDFSPNGFTLATGSDDHTVRIWDLRKKKTTYILPAHSNLISHVVYQKTHGNFLLTSSFDGTAKVWSARDFTPVVTLAGHESRIMGSDLSQDGKQIVTASFDRTWKIWTNQIPNDDMDQQ